MTIRRPPPVPGARAFRVQPTKQLIVVDLRAVKLRPVIRIRTIPYGASVYAYQGTHRDGYTDQNAADTCAWLNDREAGYPSLRYLARCWTAKDSK